MASVTTALPPITEDEHRRQLGRPVIATALFARYNTGYAIAFYILFCAVLSLISTAMLNDYTNKDISQERHLSPATP